MRGRKPKPTILKLLSGSRNPINPDEPVPEGNLVDPPADLGEQEKAMWREAIGNMPAGMLKRLDGYVLRMWCESWAIRAKALEIIKSSGLISRGAGGHPIKAPALRIVDQQTEILRGLAADLGFNPTSRARVAGSGKAGGARPPARNKFANNGGAA